MMGITRLFRKLAILLGMIKFSHTVFALPFALLSAFMAGDGGRGGFCGWGKLGLIILCMVFARSVAMTFNRIVDADIDARNPRTAQRAIPKGLITRKWAIFFTLICATGFVLSTYLFWKPVGPLGGYGNYWPVVFALPVLLFICLYSYSKRFTWASHFWLGISLMMAPSGAWVAISPPQGPFISEVAIILSLAVMLWTAGFDIVYACQDIEFDRQEGLYSVPARLGLDISLWLSRLCHSLSITLLLLLAMKEKLGMVFMLAVVLAGLLLIVEHILVRKGQMKYIKIAFGTINGTVSIIIASAGIYSILT